jgi:D-cysteine desulfhydrase
MFHNRVHRSSLDDPPTDFSSGSPLCPQCGNQRSPRDEFRLAVPTPVRKLSLPPLESWLRAAPSAGIDSESSWGGNGQEITSAELWLKDDGLCHPAYGGNKPRKLLPLLERALDVGARRLVTFGAAGSHHVLATTVLGRTFGLSTLAFVVRRPWSPHAEHCLARALAHGAELVRVANLTEALRAAGRLAREHGTFFIPPGASNLAGAEGYFWAARELLAQIDAGQVPPPRLIVIPLGSGGTAAGLLAGLTESHHPISVVAVPVLGAPALRWWVLNLATRLTRSLGVRPPSPDSLILDDRWIGRGYGYGTSEAERAVEVARDVGLGLEETYTGKAFAAACAWLRAPPARCNVRAVREASHPQPNILFWGTLSATLDASTPPSPDGQDKRGVEAAAAPWWTSRQHE